MAQGTFTPVLLALALALSMEIAPGKAAAQEGDGNALLERFRAIAQAAINDRDLTLSDESRAELDAIILSGIEVMGGEDAASEEIAQAQESLVELVAAFDAKQRSFVNYTGTTSGGNDKADSASSTASAEVSDASEMAAAEIAPDGATTDSMVTGSTSGTEKASARTSKPEPLWCPPPRLWPFCLDS